MTREARTLTLILAAVALPSCANAARRDECDRVVRELNAATQKARDEDRTASATAGSDLSAKLRALAAAYETAAIGDSPSISAQLARDVREHSDASRDAAVAARLMASALDSDDRRAFDEARADYTEAKLRERSVIAKINGYCAR